MALQLSEDLKKSLVASLGGTGSKEEPVTEKEEDTAAPSGSTGARLLAIMNDPKYQEDDTFMDKLGRSFVERTSSMGETLGGVFGGDGMKRPDPMTPMGSPEWQQYERERAPTLGEASAQLIGDVVGAGFDVVGAGIAETLDNLWGLAPEAFRQDVSQEVRDAAKWIASSSTGKRAIAAMAKGGEYLEEYKKNNPQAYKTLAKGLNIVSLGRAQMTTQTATQSAAKLPMITNKVDDSIAGVYMPSNAPQVFGAKSFASAVEQSTPNAGKTSPWKQFVDENKPETLSGRDKDVWNVIIDDSDVAVKEAVERGRYTDPSITGRETRILSAEENLQLQAVKKIDGISPLKTFRQNLKLINTRVKDLGKAIEGRLSQFKESYSWPTINVQFQKGLDEAVKKNPAIYREQAALVNYEKMANIAKDYLNKHGTDALGIHKARQQFARYYNQIADNPTTWDDGVNSPILSANFRAVYRQMNRMVDDIDGGVTANLRAEQSNLIAASRPVAAKARAQDTTAVGRLLQNLGITSHGKTSVGRARSLQYDIPILAISPFLLLLNPIRRATTMRQGVRETVADVSYGVKAARKRPEDAKKALLEELNYLKEEATKLATKDNAKQVATDIKTLASLINAIEEGTYEPNEYEQTAIQQWMNQ